MSKPTWKPGNLKGGIIRKTYPAAGRTAMLSCPWTSMFCKRAGRSLP
ncbi:hypothetical protein H3T44_08595 [Commensalibacter sp. M0355]|nr:MULTISPECIES: hypothetical protein [unclassified Commensalibacter]MBI0085516.1 hypothetical protein [Commensalibacter sp. M0355]